MTEFLFVYGTLMPQARSTVGAVQRQRLLREARVIGPAIISGRLYNLGAYPGLVVPPCPASGRLAPSACASPVQTARRAAAVQGILFQLGAPQATFRWLDPYEGIVAGSGDALYDRLIRPVTPLHAPMARKRVDAWVYAYRHPVSAGRLIADGVWVS